MVSSRDRHTCAVTSGGNVKCWGGGGGGKLGNGSTRSNPAPVAVVAGDGRKDPLGGVVQVSNGMWHTCALIEGGRVKCWGRGQDGRLGNGSLSQSNAPVAVLEGEGSRRELSGALQVSAGDVHTCALVSGGNVKCWGEGDYGNMGNDSTSDRSVPVTVLAGRGRKDPLGGRGPGELGGIPHVRPGLRGGGQMLGIRGGRAPGRRTRVQQDHPGDGGGLGRTWPR